MILTSRITNYMTNFKQLFEKDKESYAMSVDEIARKRFEKTQKAALGNLPSGCCGAVAGSARLAWA
jgi:hypothetical protein